MRSKMILGFCVALGALSGCGGASKAYVHSRFMDRPPRRVAVLPFVINQADGPSISESDRIGRDLFRKTFYHAFATYGYEDIQPDEVDRLLAQRWGSIETGGWQAARAQELGRLLQADALIYGNIAQLVHLSTPIYTQTSIKATLRMVDAKSGEVVWEQKVSAAERGGALFKKGQVVDFLKDQVRSFQPHVRFLRVADRAVEQALRQLPNPSVSAPTAPQLLSAVSRRTSGAVRLAILPLAAKKSSWQEPAERLRRYLAANLQEGPFEIVELQQVDTALTTRGWQEGEPLPRHLSIPELAHAIGADALLRGSVTSWGKSYLVVQSWVEAGLQLELVDASGEVIWSEKERNSRQAGLLKGPTGYVSVAMAPLQGLKTSHLERVANHLTRSLAEELTTAPAVLAYLDQKQPREGLVR